MRPSLLLAASLATTASAHGHLKSYTIDGTLYPSFDPAFDHEPKFGVKRVEWGFPKAKGGVGPVEDVNGPDIACRFQPLKAPAIEGVARAGANITFSWLDWFQSHKGPVLTYMGELPASGNLNDVSFFKIDESTYNPKTMQWGTDELMNNKHQRTVTIPRDLKPGTYVVRHEIISLHNALNDDFIKKKSGAQFYPQCAKIKVTGDGTATPVGKKFPGLYTWDEKGLLINIFYRPNEYLSPGPPLYKSTKAGPPVGAKAVVADAGVLTGEAAASYAQSRAKGDTRWQGAVHGTDAKHPGGGGCVWPPGQPAQIKCTDMNPTDKNYRGFAQPPQSPVYVDKAHSDRSVVKFGPRITYLFDPTKPRWEQRVAAGESPAGGAAPAAGVKGVRTGKST